MDISEDLRYRNTFKTRMPRFLDDDAEDDDDVDDEDAAAMYYTISEDDQVGLARMLKDGMSPDTNFVGSNQLGKSALHLCCEKGLEGCARLLLEAGAKVNVMDAWYQTPLMYAICTERLTMVKLLAAAGADLNCRDRYGKAATHLVLGHESTACLQALLEAGANINAADSLARTPLWTAVAEDGHMEAAACLINHGASVYCKDIREKRTPLQAAVAHSNHDTIAYLKLLIDAGSPLDTVDEFGHTCIMNLLKRCVNQQRDFNEEDMAKCKVLLDAGHDIDLLYEKLNTGLWYQFHDTALNFAILKNLPIAAEFLLKMGADPDKYGHKSCPPLIRAAQENRLDIARLLLRANCRTTGIPCSKTDITGDDTDVESYMTPLRCAIEQENWQFVELLLEAGCDVSSDRYLLTNQDVPNNLVLNLNMWSCLVEYVANPRPLLIQSRRFLRDFLGRPLEVKIAALPLPKKVKEFLLLQNL